MQDVSRYSTTQEAFWAGDFGDQYNHRNNIERLLIPKVAGWAQMLRSAHSVSSVMEFGCNIGLNLLAIGKLINNVQLNGMDINEEAIKKARELEAGSIHQGTIIEPFESNSVDLTFTAGVLIHIDPTNLPSIYENLYRNSNRYILIAEYFDPNPVSLEYRGYKDKLFKRDFAGELIDLYNLNLVDYGFFYKRDKIA